MDCHGQACQHQLASTLLFLLVSMNRYEPAAEGGSGRRVPADIPEPSSGFCVEDYSEAVAKTEQEERARWHRNQPESDQENVIRREKKRKREGKWRMEGVAVPGFVFDIVFTAV